MLKNEKKTLKPIINYAGINNINNTGGLWWWKMVNDFNGESSFQIVKFRPFSPLEILHNSSEFLHRFIAKRNSNSKDSVQAI